MCVLAANSPGITSEKSFSVSWKMVLITSLQAWGWLWGFHSSLIGFFSVWAETVVRQSSPLVCFFKVGLYLGLGTDPRFARTLEILRYVPPQLQNYILETSSPFLRRTRPHLLHLDPAGKMKILCLSAARPRRLCPKFKYPGIIQWFAFIVRKVSRDKPPE